MTLKVNRIGSKIPRMCWGEAKVSANQRRFILFLQDNLINIVTMQQKRKSRYKNSLVFFRTNVVLTTFHWIPYLNKQLQKTWNDAVFFRRHVFLFELSFIIKRPSCLKHLIGNESQYFRTRSIFLATNSQNSQKVQTFHLHMYFSDY